MMSLADVNALTADAFVAAFADVAEHSPWVAERAERTRPYASREVMIAAFANTVAEAGATEQLALLRAHPDLATKAKLTDDSNREQKGAGLDALQGDEFRRFTALNEAYKARFGFPFIFAVRGASKHQILEAFEERVNRGKDEELATALAQVGRIFRFRIEDRVGP